MTAPDLFAKSVLFSLAPQRSSTHDRADLHDGPGQTDGADKQIHGGLLGGELMRAPRADFEARGVGSAMALFRADRAKSESTLRENLLDKSKLRAPLCFTFQARRSKNARRAYT
ncbi:hypothetical protein EJ903_25655 [Azospirillum griseum]|uniref:Uncharacterized protein n=3 Tax=Azospirillum griseum TaxID=2496639 RepID=A0A431V9W0_9PROT|nr:hypothetical protein EJ903_25655 [Azospirillum griseum]